MEQKTNTTPILIIDDERANLKVMAACLTRKKYNVETTLSGKDGIRKITENNYSLIITDLKLQDMSGEEIFYYLRDTLKKSTPVIGISGSPWLLKKARFDAVLKKPFSIVELQAVVERLAPK